ncbi:uncharacterized protein LOC132629174 [Lycium barbarum]|uniref:uncharacterized protein LOC132629174 n=1 Tax=Lycium barbarum TaxID=112863 RepID=UPI00293ECE00|nr:uncharacterized protein LOC132629174 [Lycium barbarum]
MSNSTPTTSTENAITTFDINHPYHLNSSDSPGMNLINSTFDGRGFPGWRRSILVALSAKKKLGFINGNFKAPDLADKTYDQWSCVNDMVTAWLLNALSQDIKDSVIHSKTTKELLDSLEQRFGYFTRLKRLWDELDSLNLSTCCSCACVCERKAKLIKFLEDQRLIQFLMGLNNLYEQARGTILMMNPLPFMDQIYSLILQDEHQKEAYANAFIPPDSAVFMAAKTNYISGNQINKGRNSQQKFGNPV